MPLFVGKKKKKYVAFDDVVKSLSPSSYGRSQDRNLDIQELGMVMRGEVKEKIDRRSGLPVLEPTRKGQVAARKRLKQNKYVGLY